MNSTGKVRDESGGSLLRYTAGFLASWNWKCALLSATARSIVYLSAMARTGLKGSLAVVLVEMAYVSLTAGLYAGWQQKALSFERRWLGNLIVVLGVPGLSQMLDWLAHRAVGAPVPNHATVAVCIFALLSALFHLYVMRRGTFLTGAEGRSLLDDFRGMPRLILGFIVAPANLAAAWMSRVASFTPAATESR